MLNRDELIAWSRAEPRPTSRLVHWLQGYGFSPSGIDEEPYLVILDGIPPEVAETEVETALAESSAELIEGIAGGTFDHDVDDHDAFIHNLLLLAAGLGCTRRLAEALYELLSSEPLHGAYNGIDHTWVVQAALTHNQIDDRLSATWLKMARGEPLATISGGVEEALDGVLRMPASADPKDDAPAKAELGIVLKHLVEALERRDIPAAERARLFQHTIARCTRFFGGRPSPRELVELADENAWPRWAVESLPELNVALGGDRVLAWKEHLKVLASNSFRILERYCDGIVVVAALSNVPQWGLLTGAIEQHRRNSPYRSRQENWLIWGVNDLHGETALSETQHRQVHEAHAKLLEEALPG